MSKKSKSIFRISQGAFVQDVITGFSGTVTGRTQYISGCDQYLVTPVADSSGDKYNTSRWLDDHRLKKTGDNEKIITWFKSRALGLKQSPGSMDTPPIK